MYTSGSDGDSKCKMLLARCTRRKRRGLPDQREHTETQQGTRRGRHGAFHFALKRGSVLVAQARNQYMAAYGTVMGALPAVHDAGG